METSLYGESLAFWAVVCGMWGVMLYGAFLAAKNLLRQLFRKHKKGIKL